MTEEVKKCNDLHNLAMSKAEQARYALKSGDADKAMGFYTEAFEAEKEAAIILTDKYDIEPSRSVLFRSAAWLAFHAEKYREAEIMAACGLVGNPPDPLIKELREVLIATLAKLKATDLVTAA